MKSFLKFLTLIAGLNAFCFSDLSAGTRPKSYTTRDGVRLNYVIAKPIFPLFPVHNKKYAVWIFQPGDGTVVRDAGPITRYGLTSLISMKYGIIFVWPQLRRELYTKDLKGYCELDFDHRVGDLDDLIDSVQQDKNVDPNRIVLVGHSAGSEIVTKVANHRTDIEAVLTIGGGVLQLMDYLKEAGEATAWTEEAMKNHCTEGSYLKRAGTFWRQLLLSNLYDKIRNTKVPYLALLGSKDQIILPTVTEKYARQLESQNSLFCYRVIQGLGHGIGYHISGFWRAVASFENQLKH